MSDSDIQLGVDQDQLTPGDEAAVGRQLDGFAAVAAQLDQVARSEVGQSAEGQVDPPELDGQGDRDVERRDRGGRGRDASVAGGGRRAGGTHDWIGPQGQWFTGLSLANESSGEPLTLGTNP